MSIRSLTFCCWCPWKRIIPNKVFRSENVIKFKYFADDQKTHKRENLFQNVPDGR